MRQLGAGFVGKTCRGNGFLWFSHGFYLPFGCFGCFFYWVLRPENSVVFPESVFGLCLQKRQMSKYWLLSLFKILFGCFGLLGF